MNETPGEFTVIERTDPSRKLVSGVGKHQPEWQDTECPSCGSAPCGPHPDVLVCKDDGELWPCDPIHTVCAELDAQGAYLGGYALDVFEQRTTELRGGLLNPEVTR